MLAETGIWSLKYVMIYKRLMIIHTKLNGENGLRKRILLSQRKENDPSSWYGKAITEAQELGLNINFEATSKSQWKKQIKAAINRKMQKVVTEHQQKKKKMRYINKFEQKKYLTSHTQAEAKLLAKVKLNMLRAKGNYGLEGLCRFCQKDRETTQHLGICQAIEGLKVSEEEIKSDDFEITRKVVSRYTLVESRLQEEE